MEIGGSKSPSQANASSSSKQKQDERPQMKKRKSSLSFTDEPLSIEPEASELPHKQKEETSPQRPTFGRTHTSAEVTTKRTNSPDSPPRPFLHQRSATTGSIPSEQTPINPPVFIRSKGHLIETNDTPTLENTVLQSLDAICAKKKLTVTTDQDNTLFTSVFIGMLEHKNPMLQKKAKNKCNDSIALLESMVDLVNHSYFDSKNQKNPPVMIVTDGGYNPEYREFYEMVQEKIPLKITIANQSITFTELNELTRGMTLSDFQNVERFLETEKQIKNKKDPSEEELKNIELEKQKLTPERMQLAESIKEKLKPLDLSDTKSVYIIKDIKPEAPFLRSIVGNLEDTASLHIGDNLNADGKFNLGHAGVNIQSKFMSDMPITKKIYDTVAKELTSMGSSPSPLSLEAISFGKKSPPPQEL